AHGIPVLVTPAAADADPSGPASPRAEPVAGPTLDPTPSPTDAVLAELQRLGARAVLTAGPAAAQWAAGPTFPAGVAVVAVDDPVPVEVMPPEPLASLLALAEGTPADAAAVATARAAGAQVRVLGATDPRATAESV